MNPYASILRTAAAQAQAILAPMTDPDGDGEFTIAGLSGTFTGTMSIFEKVLVATPNGMEEQRQIKIAPTRSQFTSAQQTTLLGLADVRARIVARGFQWNLISIEPGAQFYVLTGVVA